MRRLSIDPDLPIEERIRLAGAQAGVEAGYEIGMALAGAWQFVQRLFEPHPEPVRVRLAPRR